MRCPGLGTVHLMSSLALLRRMALVLSGACAPHFSALAAEAPVRALLQTLTRFPRLGSCTVKVSCDERFQRTAFYRRSEEHTSELQSLMRISYAVFCLKKKNNRNPINSA